MVEDSKDPNKSLREDYSLRGFFKKTIVAMAAMALLFPMIALLYFSSPVLAMLYVIFVWPLAALLIVSVDFLLHWLGIKIPKS
jgi:hypothetical protein